MPTALSIIIVCLFGFSSFLYGDSSISVIERLASPEYEGRGVGTHGLAKAQELITKELQGAGFTVTPQSLRVFIGNELGKNNSFAGSQEGEFVPLAFSRSGKLENKELVFAGFGISLRNAGEAVYDDYEGIDAKDKIVIVMTGDPGTGAKDSIFRNPTYYPYSMPMYKVQNAAFHGAAGIILVRDPLSVAGSEPPLRFLSRQGGGTSADILAGQASIQLVNRLLNKSLKEIQQTIAATQKTQSFLVEGKETFSVELTRQVGEANNIVAILPGSDPALQKEFIVVGAHYDHLGYGGDNSMDPTAIGKIHPGADDNASGVQGVVDIAKNMKKTGGNRRPIAFVLFTAEEIGLLGSKQFVESLPFGKEMKDAKVVAMLNLDMVGRLNENKLTVIGAKSAKEFPALVDALNPGFVLQKGNDGFGSSDHASFLLQKIPSIFFTTGAHNDYHRPSDTAEKINVNGLKQIEGYAEAILTKIDSADKVPTYDPSSEEDLPPPRPGRGYGVYFGSIPEFSQNPGEDGVLLQGVRAGSPAEKAGLKQGDLVTGIGEIKVKNLYDLVFALRFYRPLDEVLVTWTRSGSHMEAKTILQARDQQ